MKFCTKFTLLFICISLYHSNISAQMMVCRDNGKEAQVKIIAADPDNNGVNELFFVVIPDVLGNNNLTIFTPEGAVVIGEDHPCRLAGTDEAHDPVLYLKRGNAYAKEDMWNIIPPDPSQARMAGGGFDNQNSMEGLRQLSLMPTDENKVGININEVKAVELLSASVGAIEYDGEIKQTFNGSQLFYHYLGAINYLDEQLEAEKTRNDDLERRLNDLERKLDRLTNPRPEAPTEDKKTTPQSSTLKVFPNPTRDNLQVEIDVKEKLENAEIHIMDTTGNLVLRQGINSDIPSINLNINDLNMQSGTYFCTLISAGKVVDTQTVTIIK